MRRDGGGFRPINILFGLMMGTADIIPGVSGGTVALIVGIYERLIGSIRSATTGAARGVRGQGARALAELRQVEWGLVLPLGAGIVIAIVIGARILAPALDLHPVTFRALFFGLIAGSLIIPWNRIPERRREHRAIAAVAAIAAFVLVGFPPRELSDPSLVLVFLAASIAICAMILPGVSGAFLLLVMGMYEPTLRALNTFDLGYVAVFILGAVTGLGLFSKLLGHLLAHHHDTTMAALVGLMAGSLRSLWPYQDESRGLLAPSSTGSLLASAAIALAGFALVFALARMGRVAEAAQARSHQRHR